jgi:hypothetical protein
MITTIGLLLKSWFSGLWEILKAVPWQAWAALLALGLLMGYGTIKYQAGYEAAEQVYIEKAEKHLKADADKDAKLKARMLVIEQGHRDAMNKIADIYVGKMGEGYEKRDKIIADLRSGNARLRKHWGSCPATGSSTGSSDEDASLRAIDTGNLIRAGSDCDATISALQSIIKSDRQK